MEHINIILGKSKLIILFLNIFLILISTIYNSKLIVVSLFYLIYIFIAYIKFSPSNRKYLYYIVLTYALVTGGNSKYVFIFYTIYLTSVIIECKNAKVNVLREKKYYIFYVIFILYMILSIFIAQDKMASIQYLLRYTIMLAIFGMMLIENRNEKDLKETFKFLFIFYVGMLFLGSLEVFGIKYGLGNIFIDKNMTSEYLKRIPEVFYYNPNNYSIVLDIGIASLFAKSLFTKCKKERIMYYILIIISEIQLIFASSRIAWIVLYCTFVFFIILGVVSIKSNKELGKKCIGRSTMAFILSFILFFCLALVPSMSPYYKKFADSIIITKVRENILPKSYIDSMKLKIKQEENIEAKIEIGGKGSENERVTLIKNVIDGVVVEKNLLGFGVGNIGIYVKNKNNTYGITNIHSFWFEYLGDFGVVMFIYLIVVYCKMLIDLLKLYWIKHDNEKQYYMILLSLGVILVLLAFAPSSVLLFSPFWIVMGINFGMVSNKLNYLA